MKPRIMFLVPAEFDSLERKGVVHLILERDEDGFFERVITVHPIARRTRKININGIHVIYEIGADLIPGSVDIRILRFLQIPIHFFRVINKILILVRKERIQVIRATDPYWMGLIGWIISILTRTPFCVSIHADYDLRHKLDPKYGSPKILGSRRMAKYLERFVLSRAGMVMPIRESLGERAVKDGASPGSIRVIPHGIYMTPFKSPPISDIFELFKLSRETAIISFVGRISKENYVDDIVELAKQLCRTRDDFVIVMAGGGNEEERLKNILEENEELKKVIRMVGFQPRQVCLDLRRVSRMSLCLMAGFSLIEACAAGRPVVAYDVEWHRELVKNGVTGFLIHENDITGLIEAVTYLLDHPEEAFYMGNNAMNLAFENHDIKKTLEIKRRWYKELLEKQL